MFKYLKFKLIKKAIIKVNNRLLSIIDFTFFDKFIFHFSFIRVLMYYKINRFD